MLKQSPKQILFTVSGMTSEKSSRIVNFMFIKNTEWVFKINQNWISLFLLQWISLQQNQGNIDAVYRLMFVHIKTV